MCNYFQVFFLTLQIKHKIINYVSIIMFIIIKTTVFYSENNINIVNFEIKYN